MTFRYCQSFQNKNSGSTYGEKGIIVTVRQTRIPVIHGGDSNHGQLLGLTISMI